MLVAVLGGDVVETARITWPLRVDESAKDIDTPTRLDLIERMGTIGGEWSAEILALAAGEEREPELRDAVLVSLVECAQRTSQPVFEQALQFELLIYHQFYICLK